MFFEAEIAVLDESGALTEVDVPATYESCWLCGGSGHVTPSLGEGGVKACPVCDGHGVVLAVAWDHVDPVVRRGFELLWRPRAWA